MNPPFRQSLFVLCLALAALFIVPTSARAQSLPPPANAAYDINHVDVTSGEMSLSQGLVSIGQNDQRGLRLTLQITSSGRRYIEVPTMSGSTSSVVVVFMGAHYGFTLNGSVYQPTNPTGATLNAARTLFVASDGTEVTFAPMSGGAETYFPTLSNLAYPTQIRFPDGVIWTYAYNAEAIYDRIFQTYQYHRRISSITNNLGYQIKFAYVSDVRPVNNVADWHELASVSAVNNAVEYCSPTATCTLTGNWQTAHLDSDSITNVAGDTTEFTFSSSSITVTPPGASSPTLTYAFSNNKVSSVSNGGGTWTYSYGTNSATVTNPASGTASLNYNSVGKATSQTVGGLVTAYSYCTSSDPNCPEGLLKSVTAPEGNKVTYTYDTRGNVTSETRVAKSGSGLANIVTSAAYPGTCTNPKTCNKPTSTTDARGQVTNYVYDAGHGGVTSIKLPADAGGVRPETRIAYANYQAYYKNSSGSIVASGTNIALPIQMASCRTAASCSGGTDERRTIIAYGPQTAGTANNLNPVSATLMRGDGALAATTALTYDNYGRAVTVDGPLSGTADMSMVRYNLAGQVIGEVAPDPDDAGTSKYPATRYSYNAWGQVYQTETGTVDGLTDTDWTNFTPTGNTVTEFDSYSRPIRQKVRNGTTTYQITDVRYDTMSRVQCSMVRMDMANWAPLPTSCSPPQANDRVTYNHYDTLGRVWKVTTGYGTSVAADEQIATFTNNGQLLTLTDAEGNKTSYSYDGHDRLARTYFPSPTTDGVSSTTDYEQASYDANGNVTAFRTRLGEVLGLAYDNLNRLTLKNVPTRSGLATTHTRDVYFGYDLFENMTYARFDSASGEGITNAYDALGRLTGTTTNLDSVSRTLSYLYDVAGNLTRITHPDGNYFNYVRRASGAFYTAQVNGSALLYPVLDAAARPYRLYRWDTTAATWTNEYTQFGYDAVSRVSSIATVLPGTSHDTTTTLTYNPASQIATSSRTNDAYAFTGHVNVNRSYTANGLNEYSAVAGTSFGYDTNGNLTSDGTNSYVYDVENRLVTRSGGASAALRYDPLGRLYEVTGASGTRRFLYDGSDLVAEYNTSGTLLRRYMHGLGAGDDPLVWFEGSGVTNAERRYLFSDERGSIVAVTNSTGSVLGVNHYDEYGIPATTNVGAFQYTGQVWLPELAMYHYKARMYSPTLGRFMQTDPIGYGDGMNMYAYVKNDPVNGVDPSGMAILVTAPVAAKLTIEAAVVAVPAVLGFVDKLFTGIFGGGGPSAFQIKLAQQEAQYAEQANAAQGGGEIIVRPPEPIFGEPIVGTVPAACGLGNCLVIEGTRPTPPREHGFDWSKLGQCALEGFKEHYGLTTAAGTSAALATPLPKSVVPPFRNIGTPTTNLLSSVGHYIDIPISKVTFGAVKNVTIRGLTSSNLLRIAGRANPYVAGALVVADGIMIGISAYRCYNGN